MGTLRDFTRSVGRPLQTKLEVKQQRKNFHDLSLHDSYFDSLNYIDEVNVVDVCFLFHYMNLDYSKYIPYVEVFLKIVQVWHECS